MSRWLKPLSLACIILCGGCDPTPIQYPPGPGQYSHPHSTPNVGASPTPPEPQVTGAQRWQHAWSKAMEGVVMGGSIGGPYGAGGGLVLGFLAGLFTADSYYGQLNNQIYSEQQKDQQLEAAIEQELERQRGLENQVAAASSPARGGPGETPSPPVEKPPARNPDPVTGQDQLELAALKKEKRSTPFSNVDVRDTNGDGVPDLWVYYNPGKPGEITRQEEATKGDGRVDSWSYFKDGKLVRREVDTKGGGRPDTVYYYREEKLSREERDENGNGTVNYRATYEDGRLVKVEKDTRNSGRMDLWLFYNPELGDEVIVKEESDLNGDGFADLWSYYERGRLVRRDVNAIGLELLSKQDQIPAPAVDAQRISIPGS